MQQPPASGPSGGAPALRYLARHAWQALAIAVVAAGGAYLAARLATPSYRATTTLLVLQPSSSYLRRGLLAPSRLAPASYRDAVRQGPIAREALQRVLGQPPSQAELRSFRRSLRIAVVGSAPSSLLRLSLTSTDPAYSLAGVRAVADALMAWDARRASGGLERSITALQRSDERIGAILASGTLQGRELDAPTRAALVQARRQRGQQLARARALSRTTIPVGLLEPLAPPASLPAQPAALAALEALAAGLLGLVAGFALLYRRRLRQAASAGSVRRVAGLPALTEFLVPAQAAPERAATAADYLRDHLLRAADPDAPNVVAVTSPRTAAEKEGVAAALAASLVRAGHSTLLVDADLRRPRDVRATGSRSSAATLEMHLENPRLDYSPEVLTLDGVRTCDFIPGTTAAGYPAELLQRGLEGSLAHWRQRYAVVVLDCPPVLPFVDTLLIAPRCSSVVVCAGHEASLPADLREATARLEDRGATLLGTVVTTGRPPRRGRFGARAGSGAGRDGAAGARVDGRAPRP